MFAQEVRNLIFVNCNNQKFLTLQLYEYKIKTKFRLLVYDSEFAQKHQQIHFLGFYDWNGHAIRQKVR